MNSILDSRKTTFFNFLWISRNWNKQYK